MAVCLSTNYIQVSFVFWINKFICFVNMWSWSILVQTSYEKSPSKLVKYSEMQNAVDLRSICLWCSEEKYWQEQKITIYPDTVGSKNSETFCYFKVVYGNISGVADSIFF